MSDPHAVTRSRGNDDWEFQCFRSFGQSHHVVFELARGNVPDARHETDLMIDEHERGILGSQRFVRTPLIIHCILLLR